MAFNKSALLVHTLADLTQFFRENQAQTYLLAVSGGLDSMVLCHLLLELQLPVQILHVNYGLRGAESNADQALVAAYCQQHRIQLEVLNVSLKEQLTNNKLNLQAEARKIRYEFFKEIQMNKPKSQICTAHHADDQIETFWLQLSRGSGLKGLAGMARADQHLLRPLLTLNRDDILALAKELKVSWREDSSNASLKYRRNLWRHQLLPFLNARMPKLKEAVELLQKTFAQEITAQEQVLNEAISHFKKYKSISLIKLSQLSAYQYIELFKYVGVPTHAIKRISDLFKAENGKYIAWKNDTTKSQSYLVKQRQQITLFNEAATEWSFQLKTPAKEEKGQQIQLLIDTNQIKGEPYFRQVKSGDSIRVKGMKGSKKVLRILKEAGIPAPLRNQQIILCDQEKVLAIPQLYVNAAILATQNTAHLAVLAFIKKS
jgi:tRNA(Ile)-lysidine synthase